MKPAAQGTKHCHRKVPRLPVLKVNTIVLCASASVHGATLHWFGALSPTPLSGTLTPSSGIANVCEVRLGSRVLGGFPFTVSGPTVPWNPPQHGLRSPVAVSYW